MRYFNLKICNTTLKLVHILTLILLSGLFFSGTAQNNGLEDEAITNAIESEFWIDEVIDMNNIDVETQDGVVVLAGTVNNILSKDRAVRIAESVKGVRSIVNRIEVKPLISRTDDELRVAIENALLNDPATEAFETDVAVNNGHVTLTGTVQSWAEKELCAQVAKGVKGVRDLSNEISIKYETERPDVEIERDIKGRLSSNVWLDDTLIDVEVDNSKVSLTGTVGSLSEKNRAASSAWVAGVESVDVADLKVEWWAQDQMKKDRVYTTRSDPEIREAVKDAFLYDPRVKFFNPDVSVDMGTVTLTGIVDNLQAKRAAEQDARNTAGVWRVKNHLKVRPEEIPADDKLEQRIENRLLNDPYIERYEINIDASNGLVYLSGTVNTSFEKFHTERIVASVEGVTDIVNNIESEYEWTWKPDWEIKEDVKDQFTWSTLVDQEDINIDVDNGIVTLSGEVDSWSEFNAAENNAYQGGAKDVDNNLTVKYREFGPFYPFGYWSYPYFPHF